MHVSYTCVPAQISTYEYAYNLFTHIGAHVHACALTRTHTYRVYVLHNFHVLVCTNVFQRHDHCWHILVGQLAYQALSMYSRYVIAWASHCGMCSLCFTSLRSTHNLNVIFCLSPPSSYHR